MKIEKMPWGKSDFSKAHAVSKMAESEGYKVLAAFWLPQREALISKVSDTKCLNRDFESGSLHGFNLAISMAERIVNEAMKQKEEKKDRNEVGTQFED